ncbi:hypothetical protein BX600DRAFT_508619 [Xylariales sp. PMI_506]|nr:hypothetical protein BX600DRAFT_508619 [Xylariales sp. PMI_506]
MTFHGAIPRRGFWLFKVSFVVSAVLMVWIVAVWNPAMRRADRSQGIGSAPSFSDPPSAIGQEYHVSPLEEFQSSSASQLLIAPTKPTPSPDVVTAPTTVDEEVPKAEEAPLQAPVEEPEPVPDPPAPSTLAHSPWSKIGKVTMLYYDEPSNDTIAYEDALEGHAAHNNKFGYRHFVLRRDIVAGLYSKPTYMLSLLLQELTKPPEERIEWLFWHDADVVLLNHNIPLEVFLPPPGWEHVNLVISNDVNGLNNGVFFIRVDQWSVQLLNAVTSYQFYNPKVELVFNDQSAMEFVAQEEPYRSHTMHVPQGWFNSYNYHWARNDVPPEWEWRCETFEPGHLLVHFPGTYDDRAERMEEFLEQHREEPEKYDVPYDETFYPAAIAKFWRDDAGREEARQEAFTRMLETIHAPGEELDRAHELAVEELKASMEGADEDAISEAVGLKYEQHLQTKIQRLREVEKARAVIDWPKKGGRER